MRKRFLAFTTAALVAMGMFAGCGSNGASQASSEKSGASSEATAETEKSEATEATEATAEKHSIGMNTWFQGVYALDAITNNASQVFDVVGDDVTLYNDEANTEKIINDLETMHSAQVDGIMWIGMFDNNFSVGPQIANGNKEWFALYDKAPSDEGVREKIRNMEYFAGGAYGDNYSAGVQMAELALADGCRAALIAGAEVGDPSTDLRVEGFTTTFEAGGGKILNVARVSSSEANGPQTACDNMLAGNPEADCFYCTGQDFVLGAISTSKKGVANGEVRVYGCDLNPELLEYLESGDLSGCSGAHWVSGMFSAILLENALDGKVMLDSDGLAILTGDIPFISVSADQAQLYKKFFCDEQPYETEEIQQMLYRYNPDVTGEDILNAIANYSFEERMTAKYNAGKVTAEELAEVGVVVE